MWFWYLKDDVTVLEGARSELLAASTDAGMELEQHNGQSAADLSDLLNTVKDNKEKVDNINILVEDRAGSRLSILTSERVKLLVHLC